MCRLSFPLREVVETAAGGSIPVWLEYDDAVNLVNLVFKYPRLSLFLDVVSAEGSTTIISRRILP
jgi:hypothetical protein